MDAKSIVDTMIPRLQSWGLNMSLLVAQGYDGASIMSSDIAGVQARVKNIAPNATYVHCRSHVLNLAISSSCRNVPPIRNLFDSISKITWFLGGSAKRKQIFIKSGPPDLDQQTVKLLAVNQEEDTNSVEALNKGAKRKTVPKFCATRWSARLDAPSAMIVKYRTVMEALEEIARKSSGDARSDAENYVRQMENSQFIVAIISTQFVLSHLGDLTKALQSVNCNLSEAYRQAELAKECIRAKRNSWGSVWDMCERLAELIDVELKRPRTPVVQIHRHNAGQTTQSACDYYRRNVFYPFVDHVVQELDLRFHNNHDGLIYAQMLLPSHLNELSPDTEQRIENYYSKFLNAEEVSRFHCELERWKKLFESIPFTDSYATIPKECTNQSFPIIRRILAIFFTTPVGSVACERSFSCLRRLKTWQRTTMTENRLNGLALLHVNQESNRIPSPEEIYRRKANWRF